MVVPQAENIGPRNKILYDQRLISIIDNANTSVDTDVTVAFKVSPSEYQLNAYFNYGKEQGGKFFVEPLGTWSVKNGLNIFSKKYKFYRRFDFNKLGIRFILVARGDSLKSFNIESMNNPNYDPNFLHSSKITTHVLRTLAETHNISYIYTVTDRWIGNYEKNSSRVVSTSLYFREQDISNVIRFKYPGILDRLDFATGTSSNVEAHFFYRIPTKGVGKFENKFLIPFTYASWLCVIGLLALCAVFLSVAARVERRPSAGQYGPFSVLAALCQQFYEDISSEDPMGSSAGRKIGIFVTGTSCVLIYNYYTSSVVSWLLNGPPPLINSLEELNDSPLNVILEDIGYVRSWLYSPGYFFNSKTIKAEDEMRKKKVQTKKAGDPLLEPLDKGIQMVKEGGYAFLMQSSVAGLCFSKILTRMELCELGSLSTIPATPCYSAIQRRSPFKEFYNWGLTRMKERGHANYATRVFYAPVLKCDGTLPRPLALGGAAPAFVLLAFGMLISLFILIAEILLARSSDNKVNRVIEV
uniref:Putative ionotropic receptor 8 n=1 Tax=Conopomorpha sinensis TaxID=940481 RepID=A0A3S7SGU3_9NEOP|nr:putative ionotropic receptor 8 [Conopomorpha sinensis]